MNIEWNYLLPGALGILLHTFAVKLPSLNQKAIKANHPFSVAEWFKNDWWTIAASFAAVLILIVGLDEAIQLKPAIKDYIKWLFAFVGFTGSSLIQAVFSVMNRKLMAVIDIKTNLADGVVPPVTPENKEGVEEIKKED